VASPNPEGNESDDKAGDVARTTQQQQRQANRETQPLHVDVNNRDSAHSNNKCSQPAEYRPKLKLWLNILLTFGTLGAFAAAAVYASYAKQQVAQAESREWIELRAYVSVGASQGQGIRLINAGSPQAKATIQIRFTNAGRTPARHFSVLVWSNLKSQGPQIEFRTRWKGFGTLLNPGLEHQDATLGSEASYTDIVQDEWVPTSAQSEDLETVLCVRSL